MKITQQLHDLGQSLWLDNITRDLLTSGTLARYVSEFSVTGLTSNPTIFDHAIGNADFYDAAIRIKDRVPQALRNRHGIAIAMRTYKAYRELLSSSRWQKLAGRRRASATPAVGQHRHQRPRRIGRSVRRSDCGAGYHRHLAREDAARLCRAR